MSIDFDIFFGCPFCTKRVDTTFQQIQNHKLLKCTSCNREFTIHDAYDYYYKNIPLVRGSIDLLTKYAGNYAIKPTDDKSHLQIEQFLKNSNFDVLLKDAFQHMFLYGDAFILLKKDESGKITSLQLLHPKNVSIELGGNIQRGQAYTGEREIKGIKVKEGENIKNYTKEDVVHLKGHDIWSYDTYGDSILRIVLTPLYNLRFAIQTGNSQLIQFLENQVIPGLGVPKSMVERQLSKIPIATILVSLFTMHIGAEQSHVRGELQEMIEKIASSMNLKTIPSIELKKPNDRVVLAYCGYDMTKEIEALNKLRDTGIFTPSEFENIKKQLIDGET
ncbi:Putative phage portal/genetic exchange protein [Nitrosotalea devaniterrae]|uniref:Phage portal/genetic exchange protein n=1 Tax=Nitrosotalea devaniterrae TaxID=1078905 RepID=A0A128A635_9ARCH|nr:Putative phage portal/genetic exchange protein [Candidatus Nitrosotalea devanaterra]